MTDTYQKEVLLRPAVEFYAGVVALSAALVLWLVPGVLMIPYEVAFFASMLFFVVGLLDCWGGYKILRYRRGMSRQKPFTIKARRVPRYDDRLYIGHGFEWTQRHTQRFIDTFDPRYGDFINRKEYYFVRTVERWLSHIPILSLIAKFTRSTWVLNPWPPKSNLGGTLV